MLIFRAMTEGGDAGIVHIGVGGFNRSHLAVFLNDLLALDAQSKPPKHDKRLRWGEFGVGLLPGDREIHEALVEQDYLYGVLERDAHIGNYRVIGSLVGHHYGRNLRRRWCCSWLHRSAGSSPSP